MKTLFGRLARFIVRHPALVIALSIALTVALGAGMTRLRMDSDMTDDIPSTIPEKAFYDSVASTFPTNDVLIVAFSDSKGAYSTGSLAQAAEWTERIANIEDIKSVLSLANATGITGTEDGIVIDRLMKAVPQTDEEVASFRSAMETSEMTAALVGRDGKAQAMMISVDPEGDTRSRPRVMITFPETVSAADRAAFLASAASLADGSGNALVSRAYSGDSETDAFDAASTFAVTLGKAKDGAEVALVRPSDGADRATLMTAIEKLAKPLGARAKYSDSQVSMYDRMSLATALMPHYADGKVYISGSKAVTSVVGKLMISDLATLFPIVVAIIILILYLSFRTMRGVFLPFANVIMATIMAMGFMGWCGQPISMATMVLPIILIAVGTAYAIHVINRYYEDVLTISDPKEAIVSTLEHVSIPILLAAVTTMIGFGSLAVSSISALRVYGLLASLGIFFALVLAVTFTPAILVLLKIPERKKVEERNTGVLSTILDANGRLIARRPKLVIAVTLGIVAVCAIGIPLIQFESNTVESFRKGTGIRESSEYLNDNFTGITIMTVVVRAQEDGAILESDVLSAMDGFQRDIGKLRFSGRKLLLPGDGGYDAADDLIGGTQSITTFVRGINKAMHADDPAFDKIPDAITEVPVTTESYSYASGKLVERDSQYGDVLRELEEGKDFTVEGGNAIIPGDGISRCVSLADGTAVDLVGGRTYAGQLVFQYENSGDPENIEAFIDNPRRTAKINVFVRTGSSTVSNKVQKYAREYINAHFPKGVQADITGLSALNLTIMRLLVNTQISSVITSLLVILVMISLINLNIVEGLFSIIPLSASLVINFGLMGFAGIAVDISTATIASIAIGIGIDYTLHFMERLKFMVKEMSLEKAVVATMVSTGKGIIYNAIAVAGGFVALMFSQIKGNFNMGLLMAIIMVVASLFAITLLPAAIIVAKPKFIAGIGNNEGERK